MNFIFESLLISDISKKCAKVIHFSEHDNLITSDMNSMGKSVLMKSLYHALGADSDFDKNFDEQNVLFSLQFRKNDNRYRSLRFKDAFAILKNGKMIDYINAKARPNLSLFFKNEFGLSVYLKNREETTEIAPPAYLFIPYYLDQDRSWKEDQYPFSRSSMSQYKPISKNDLYFYHLGIFSSEYGNIKSNIEQLNVEIKQKQNELQRLDEEYNAIKKSIDNEFVVTNADELESIYRIKSKEFNVILKKQNKKLSALFLLDQKRINCLLQIRNNQQIISKIDNNLDPKSFVVKCPNCNEEFDVQLKNEVVNIYSKVLIEKENESLSQEEKQLFSKIQSIKLEIDEMALSLDRINKEVIKSKADYDKFVARKAFSSVLDKHLSEIGKTQNLIDGKNEELKRKQEYLKEIKVKTKEVKEDFCEEYTNSLYSLGITNFDSERIEAFTKLRLSGSQYVRSTLALFFAFLKTKSRIGFNDFGFPLVIDSPREGEQDEYNSSNILKMILNEKIGDTQRIVASVNASKYLSSDIISRINLITLNGQQNSVMTSMEYEKNKTEIESCFTYFKRIS